MGGERSGLDRFAADRNCSEHTEYASMYAETLAPVSPSHALHCLRRPQPRSFIGTQVRRTAKYVGKQLNS
jgi:hypothetical protein